MKIKPLFVALSLAFTLFSASVFASDLTIIGAGATFPYPVYSKWAQAYQESTAVHLNYQPIGSGGGIKQIQAKTVDFGASDKPLSNQELQKNHLIQFPTVIGGVVAIVNIPDITSGQLKLSAPVLASIYLGEIKKWNDVKITELNPDLSLLDMPITVVHRSDGSGTTFLFTDYLNKVSPTWKTKVGSDTAVSWPTGIGGKGNEGVASYVQRVKGSIGYVEYAYAEQNKLAYSLLKNKAGTFVSPSINTFQAAAANAHWSGESNFVEILTDQAGKDSWPISGATFVLMQQTQDDTQKAQAILKFFAWAYSHGKTMTTELDYVPLPDAAVKLVQDYWKARIRDKSGKPLWP